MTSTPAESSMQSEGRVPSTNALSNYRSYLVRLWRADEYQNWRIMVEYIGSERRYGFSSLESFFDFLRQQTEEVKQEKQT